jgi:hypothetical protein
MAKLKAFVRLDFMTVKPYLTVKNFAIYALIMIFLTSVTGNISSGIGVGFMLGTTFTGYPFALGEKNSLDTLYATLSLSRKTVVTGRYLFALILNLCAVLIALPVSALGILVSRAFDTGGQIGGTFLILLALFAMFFVVQAVQLPLLFKMGYARAKFFGLIPFCAIMAAYSAITALAGKGGALGILNAAADYFKKNLVVAAAAAVLAACLTAGLSYGLSLKFYRHREF